MQLARGCLLSRRFDCLKDLSQDDLYLIQYLIVRKAEETETHLSQGILAFLIFLSLLLVDGPIDLDDQRSFPAKEIDNETVDNMLTPKFVTSKPVSAQMLP